jgi:hypothetical protein
MTLLAQQTVLLQESAARNVGVRTIRENQTCAEEHSMKHWCGIDLSAVTQNRQLKVEIKGFKTGHYMGVKQSWSARNCGAGGTWGMS